MYGTLISILGEQVDKRREWCPVRRAPSYDLPAQRDTSKPPFCYRHTREARNIRVCPAFCILFSHVPAESQSRHSEDRATGVAFTLNPLFHPDASGLTETLTVRGTRLVVLSAGSFGSPGILERSGIGAKGVLESVGVKQRVDLPGVGENYQGLVQDYISESARFTFGHAQTTTFCSSRAFPRTRHRHSMQFSETMMV